VDYEAEGNLGSDQSVHQTRAGVRIASAFEGADGSDGGRSECGREAEEEGYTEG